VAPVSVESLRTVHELPLPARESPGLWTCSGLCPVLVSGAGLQQGWKSSALVLPSNGFTAVPAPLLSPAAAG
jgi:hypothetical protein